jgi:hypothetical protein
LSKTFTVAAPLPTKNSPAFGSYAMPRGAESPAKEPEGSEWVASVDASYALTRFVGWPVVT